MTNTFRHRSNAPDKLQSEAQQTFTAEEQSVVESLQQRTFSMLHKNILISVLSGCGWFILMMVLIVNWPPDEGLVILFGTSIMGVLISIYFAMDHCQHWIKASKLKANTEQFNRHTATKGPHKDENPIF